MHACILPSDPHTYTQVIGDEFDQWVEEHALPLPPATLGRYEAARQKRLDLFKKDVVARHWRQRLDMAHTHTRSRTHTHTHTYMYMYMW